MIRLPELEVIDFDKCGERKSGIHHWSCYAMFQQNQSGLARITRALRHYHSPPPHKGKTLDAGDSFVGDPHLICECLERLQYLRFQTLCTMKAEFVTMPNEQSN